MALYAATDNHLPPQFELPFEFRGDPVMSCNLNGTSIARCVLDTGAACTVIRYPENAHKLIGDLAADQFTIVKSLIINSIEFGPLRVKAKCTEGLSEPEVYLGTAQLKSHSTR